MLDIDIYKYLSIYQSKTIKSATIRKKINDMQNEVVLEEHYKK